MSINVHTCSIIICLTCRVYFRISLWGEGGGMLSKGGSAASTSYLIKNFKGGGETESKGGKKHPGTPLK